MTSAFRRAVFPAALLAALGGCSSERNPEAVRPNVLLIVLDTTRADFFSSYGFPAPTTPSIDRLADSGTRYDKTFSTSHWTLPAHASLFTGLYPSEAQATTETRRLPSSVETLAETLRGAGYRTRAASSNPWVAKERGFDQGFEEFVETWRPPQPGPPLHEAVRWIDELAAGDDPFLIFLNFNTPHLPYDPVAKQRDLFVGADRSIEEVERLSKFGDVYGHLVGEQRHDEEDFEILRELYAAEIHIADAFVGHVVARLDSVGLLDETLVIVVSDHGENIGEHGALGHVVGLHDTLLRVPMIIRYPPRFEPGSVNHELQSLIDVTPTVLDVCGVVDRATERQVKERSLSSPARRVREYVVAEANRPLMVIEQLRQHYPDFDTSGIDHRIVTIRDARYKVVRKVGKATEVYDLEQDPGETTDLAGRLPDLETDRLAKLERWAESLREVEPAEQLETEDPEALQRLRDLGYIH